jgi:SPP1 gp7 family putative phage head morphogenesis protein
MRGRSNRLKGAVKSVVSQEDEFALAPRQVFSPFNTNSRAFEFKTLDEKLAAFNAWLVEQIRKDILSAKELSDPNSPWTAKYVESAYRKGFIRSYNEKNPKGFKSDDFHIGGQNQFLKGAFGQPERVSKIKLLGLRSYEDLKGVTGHMAGQLNRIFSDALAHGIGPGETAQRIAAEVNGIDLKRAFVLARTEIIHAHAEGQLDGFEELGVYRVGIMAEFMTAGDTRVCERCFSMEGMIFTIEEARGIIPLHPQCRCAWRAYLS